MYDSNTPTGKLARARIVSAAAAQAGLSQLKFVARATLAGGDEDEGDEVRRQRDEAIAKTIFNALGQLRGTALKISQMLAAEADLLPPLIREELAKARYRVPALNRAVVRKAVIANLGNTPEALFATFDSQAFAGASIGQVHRATERGTGRPLAVKVQYPGISEAITNDVQVLRSLFFMLNSMNAIPQAKAVEPMLDEIEARLFEEVNYKCEAEATQWFHEHLQIDRVQTPEVVQNLSGPAIMTTTLLQGKHLDEWLAGNPPQEERDQFGQLLVDVFFKSLFELGFLHADPNPGNYLFMPDGSLGLVDFGCAEALDVENVRFIASCFKAYVANDLERVVKEYQSVGMLSLEMKAREQAEFIEKLVPSQEWISMALGQPEIDFSKVPDFMSRIRHATLTLGPSVQQSRRGLLYFTRAFTGLFWMLTQLGAKVKMAHLVPDPSMAQALRATGTELSEMWSTWY